MTTSQTHSADGRPRARGLGIPPPGEPGQLNAITDDIGCRDRHRSPRLPHDRLVALLGGKT